MRATRAYLAGLGTAGTLVLAASILFVLGSAMVTYNGWPKLGGVGSPATQTLTAHPRAGSHSPRGLASVKVVKPHPGAAAGVPAEVANKRRTLLAQAGIGTATHSPARHSTSATISHPVAGRRPTPSKTGAGGGGSGSGGSGGSGSGGGATTVTVPVVTTPVPVSATPTTPAPTGSGSGGQGGSGSGSSNPGTPVVKTGSGTVVVTMPSSSGSRPTGTPVISSSGSVGSTGSSGGSPNVATTSSSTTTTSSSTTTTSSSSTSTTVTISSPTSTGTRAGSGPILR